MALTYGFYTSSGGDRTYTAEQLSEIFNGIITDGIFASVGTQFIVAASSGMNLTVGVGRAWFNSTWTDNSTGYGITVDTAEIALNRIDTAVIEVNKNVGTRANSIKIVKGTPASNPVAPTLTQAGNIYQYALADIYVGAGVTTITADKITNRVGTTGAPFITAVLESVDIDDLLAQWDAEFNVWFDQYKDVIDESAAANLLNIINQNGIHPYQVGYTTDLSTMTTYQNVDANFQKLKDLLASLKSSGGQLVKFSKLWSLKDAFAKWFMGDSFPVGFYGDGVINGFSTTSYVASTYVNAAPFKVTINTSPNSFPNKMKDLIDIVRPGSSVRIYNGGMHSLILQLDGLRQWYNTWFRGLNGSNVNWSDVKMIFIGFSIYEFVYQADGTTDYQAYETNLECLIIDAYLRGVQPVLLNPMLVLHEVGTTISGRHVADHRVLVEAIHERLAKKYDLDVLDMSRPFENMFTRFQYYKISSYIESSTNLAYPNNSGHLFIAQEIVRNIINCTKIEPNETFVHLWPGHPSYIQGDATDIIAPSGDGGVILQNLAESFPGMRSNSTYIYRWLSPQGNGKLAGEKLLSAFVWVDRPTALFWTIDKNNKPWGDTKTTKVYNAISNTEVALPMLAESHHQPIIRMFTDKAFICLLPYGLNRITLYNNSDTNESTFCGYYLAEMATHFNMSRGRGTSGDNFFNKYIPIDPIVAGYTNKVAIRKEPFTKYIDSMDNAETVLQFNMGVTLTAGVTMTIASNYHDYKGIRDAYNYVEIVDDTLKLYRTDPGNSPVQILNETITGLRAALTYGARVRIEHRSHNYSDHGGRWRLRINETLWKDYTYNTCVLFTNGYGVDITGIHADNIFLTSRVTSQGFAEEYLY